MIRSAAVALLVILGAPALARGEEGRFWVEVERSRGGEPGAVYLADGPRQVGARARLARMIPGADARRGRHRVTDARQAEQLRPFADLCVRVDAHLGPDGSASIRRLISPRRAEVTGVLTPTTSGELEGGRACASVLAVDGTGALLVVEDDSPSRWREAAGRRLAVRGWLFEPDALDRQLLLPVDVRGTVTAADAFVELHERDGTGASHPVPAGTRYWVRLENSWIRREFQGSRCAPELEVRPCDGARGTFGYVYAMDVELGERVTPDPRRSAASSRGLAGSVSDAQAGRPRHPLRFEECEHEEIEPVDHGDVISEPPNGVWVSVTGVCLGCGATCSGSARQASPDGDLEDHEYEEFEPGE